MVTRITQSTELVLQALLADPEREHYGSRLGSAAALPSGTVHPILARLERAGWVGSRWEEIDPAETGRPRRRYYRLTPDGRREATAAVFRAHNRRSRLTARTAEST
jgi:DNA-binding PadR family transcriptional regulator